uniref:Uncharacterized protein n=1 Tax=Rhizophora mucronata TaxID=61149 RepID=A0A2P2QQ04_RHIMU
MVLCFSCASVYL